MAVRFGVDTTGCIVYTPSDSGLPGIWLETTDTTSFTPPATVACLEIWLEMTDTMSFTPPATVACLEISLEILTFRHVPSFTPPVTVAQLEMTS